MPARHNYELHDDNLYIYIYIYYRVYLGWGLEYSIKKMDVGIAVLVYKVRIQGGSDNTAPFTHNYPYISRCKLQHAVVSSAATFHYTDPAYSEFSYILNNIQNLYNDRVNTIFKVELDRFLSSNPSCFAQS